MTKKSRKLGLHRETLVHLDAVRGGEAAATVLSCVQRCAVASNYLTTCCPPISQLCPTHTPECITI